MTAPRSIAQWEMDQQREQRDPALRRRDAYIPEHLRSLTWDDYEEGAGTEEDELKDILIDYAENWTPQERAGVVLLGKPGYGKTLGAVLLAMDVIDAGGWVKYITHDQLNQRKKKLIGLEQQAEADGDWGAANAEAYRLMFIEQECDLLVLDDVGKAYRAAATGSYADNTLDSLLRRRVELGKSTVLTSNLSREQWAQFDESMASFLYELGEVVELTRGRDYRWRRPEAQRRRRARG